MKYLLGLLFLPGIAVGTAVGKNSTIDVAPACSQTSGQLTLRVSSPRNTGISPFLAFFDATATTDTSVANSVTQDVTFTWNFGDTLASGTGNWTYGSNPNGNSMNAGSGIVSAHLYRTAGRDTKYTVTVTATDGTNTVTCGVGVTAYDPNGAHGFPGTATTCVYNRALGSGCPGRAATLRTFSIQTALSRAYGNGKRVLFKCGDTFSGDTGGNANLTAIGWAIGAYGGCQDTTSSRPKFSNSGSSYIFQFSNSNGNGAISDFDCEGNDTTGGGCIWANTGPGVQYQNTIYNGYSNNESRSYNWSQCSQCGIVQSVMTGMGSATTSDIGVFINFSGYNPPYTGSTLNNINYQALIGNHFDGGMTNPRYETTRVAACQFCYIADNDFLNAGVSYSQLKFHEANTYNSCSIANSCYPCTSSPTFATADCWVGTYSQYDEISDNYFSGTAGAFSLELTPQNAQADERLRYIVAERNVFISSTSIMAIAISGVNITARDNAIVIPSNSYFGIQVYQRGVEPAPQNVELYNNSIYLQAASININSAIELGNTGQTGTTQPSNIFVKNNLIYLPGNTRARGIINLGSRNTISNNSATTAANPSWTDASGTFKKITDWKPTANYSGGMIVPVIYDALGTPWFPMWDLGAVHH